MLKAGALWPAQVHGEIHCAAMYRDLYLLGAEQKQPLPFSLRCTATSLHYSCILSAPYPNIVLSPPHPFLRRHAADVD